MADSGRDTPASVGSCSRWKPRGSSSAPAAAGRLISNAAAATETSLGNPAVARVRARGPSCSLVDSPENGASVEARCAGRRTERSQAGHVIAAATPCAILRPPQVRHGPAADSVRAGDPASSLMGASKDGASTEVRRTGRRTERSRAGPVIAAPAPHATLHPALVHCGCVHRSWLIVALFFRVSSLTLLDYWKAPFLEACTAHYPNHAPC